MFDVVTQIVRTNQANPTDVNQEDLSAFSSKVNEKLQEGWKLDKFEVGEACKGIIFVQTFQGCVQNCTVAEIKKN